MKLLKNRIIKDGIVLNDSVLKVDRFLNHQIDPQLMMEIGREFAYRFSSKPITKILTIESSGIAPALMTGWALNVPVVFARKRKSLTMNNVYQSTVFSYTKQETNTLIVSKSLMNKNEHWLLIDDFLANGQAAQALIDIVQQSGGFIEGIGIVIEKTFQPGGKQLREKGIHVESLAMIKSLENGTIIFDE